MKLEFASREDLQKIKAVFFDIDDTFSGGFGSHQISDVAYSALWDLKRAGIKVIPVTGRPAGWCDMIARMWPVDGVVGENGAFYTYFDKSKKKLVKKYLESDSTRKKNATKLVKLESALQKKFKGFELASDQFCREFDLAVDYCEDVKPWPAKKVDDLIAFARAKGAIAKLSSIHVNIWYGDYDKLTCVRKMMKDHFKIDAKKGMHEIAYLGDSPNDEPFFEALPFTVGVKNVERFLPKMKSHPKYIASKESGEGFAEFVKILLAKR